MPNGTPEEEFKKPKLSLKLADSLISELQRQNAALSERLVKLERQQNETRLKQEKIKSMAARIETLERHWSDMHEQRIQTAAAYEAAGITGTTAGAALVGAAMAPMSSLSADEAVNLAKLAEEIQTHADIVAMNGLEAAAAVEPDPYYPSFKPIHVSRTERHRPPKKKHFWTSLFRYRVT